MKKDYKKLKQIFRDDPEMLRILEAEEASEQGDTQTELLKELVRDKARSDTTTKMVKIEYLKGDDGDTPVKGEDYFTEEEIEAFKKDVTPVKGVDYFDGEDGDDGKDYILTDKDKREIGQSIRVPVVEKVIEKTTVVEKPIEILPEQIAEKLNILTDAINPSVIIGYQSFDEILKKIKDEKLIELKDVKGARLDQYSKANGGYNMNDQRWHGGGSGGSGGAGTLAATLLLGNTTGGTDIVVSTGDQIIGETDLLLSAAGGNNFYYAGSNYIFQQWDGGGGDTDFLLQGQGTQLFSHTAIDIQTDTGLYGFFSGSAASKTGTFNFTALTADRTYTWPNKSGTVAMTSDIAPGGANTQVQYNNNGVFGGITSATSNGTVLTLTNPVIVGALLDNTLAYWIRVLSSGTPTNEFTIANADAGANPKLIAGGTDADVGMDFEARGAGTFNFRGNATQAATIRLYEDTDTGTNYSSFKIGTQAGNIDYTLPTTVGSAGEVLTDVAGNGVLSWETPAGGGITIGVTTITGGADTYVMFNDGGFVGNDAGLQYNKGSDVLTVVNKIVCDGGGVPSVPAFRQNADFTGVYWPSSVGFGIATAGLGHSVFNVGTGYRTGLSGVTSPQAALHIGAGIANANYGQTKWNDSPLQTVAEAGTMIYKDPHWYVAHAASGIYGRITPQMATVNTTNATVTTLDTYTIPATTTYMVEVEVVARRTGGAGGTAEDGLGATLRATYKNVAGTATLIGSVITLYKEMSDPTWDVTMDVTGATARVRVTGGATSDVTWNSYAMIRTVS